jgi:hypothetical protein
MALRKRNQTQQAEKNQNFIYHFHIPLSQTTAQINQKVVYTTFRPVNLEHCQPPHSLGLAITLWPSLSDRHALTATL